MKKIRKGWMMAAALSGAAFWSTGALADDAMPVPVRTQAADATHAMSHMDEKVLLDLHHGNLKEVSMGKLAELNASDKKVKDFGARMVKDHGKLDQDLLDFAKDHNLPMADKLAEQTAPLQMENKLQGLTGADFDHQYMTTMVQDHTKDIERVSLALEQTTDKDARKLLDHTLSVMKDHQKQAQDWVNKQASHARKMRER